jgi:hypothetical protein
VSIGLDDRLDNVQKGIHERSAETHGVPSTGRVSRRLRV